MGFLALFQGELARSAKRGWPGPSCLLWRYKRHPPGGGTPPSPPPERRNIPAPQAKYPIPVPRGVRGPPPTQTPQFRPFYHGGGLPPPYRNFAAEVTRRGGRKPLQQILIYRVLWSIISDYQFQWPVKPTGVYPSTQKAIGTNCAVPPGENSKNSRSPVAR